MSYNAFISYSHAADGRMAPKLQQALHRFAKPWWKLRALSVFRDETDLAAASSLSGRILAALNDSQFFIFLASPRAAKSKWCRIEVKHWLERRPADTVLIVLTEGSVAWDDDKNDIDWTKTDALPSEMAGKFQNEPFWLDLSWVRDREELSPREPRFQNTVAKLAATLHGKSLSEISGEDVREHARTRRIAQAAVGAIALFAVSSAVGGIYAWQQRGEAIDQRARAVEQRTIADAQRALAETRRADAEQARGEEERQRAIAETRRTDAERARAAEEQQRKQAERNLVTAQRMVDVLIEDVVFDLRKSALPKDKARALLEKVGSSLDSLDDGDATGKTAEQRFNMYAAMADNFLALGDTENAVKFGDMAVRQGLLLAKSEPANSDRLGKLANVQMLLGEVHYTRGAVAEAQALFLQAQEIARDLAAKEPASRHWRGFNGLAMSRVALASRAAGDMQTALDFFRRSIAELDVATEGTAPEYGLMMAKVVAKSGLVEAQVGLADFAAALLVARSLIADGDIMGPAIADDAEWQMRLAHGYLYGGISSSATGDPKAGLAMHERAEAILRGLIRRDGTNLVWQLDAIMNQMYTGFGHRADGNMDEAIRSLRGAHAASEAIVKRNGRERVALNRLSYSSLMLGDLLDNTGDRDGAIKVYRSGLAAGRAMYELSREAIQSAQAVVQTLLQLGDLEARQGEYEVALKSFEEAGIIAQAMAKQAPDNPMVQFVSKRARDGVEETKRALAAKGK